MLQTLVTLRWPAVLAATAAYYFLGGLWYAQAVLGRFYERALGFDRPPGWRPALRLYLGPLAACLAASIATAMLARATGARTLSDGLALGLVAGLGYAAAMAGMDSIAPHNAKPGALFAIVGSYHVVGLLIVSAIVTLWR